MRKYIYPKNLKSRIKIGFWSIRNVAIIVGGALISIIIYVNTLFGLPLLATGAFAVFTIITNDERTVGDYLIAGAKLYLTEQQLFKWKGLGKK